MFRQAADSAAASPLGRALIGLLCLGVLFACSKPQFQGERGGVKAHLSAALIDIHGHVGTFKGYDLSLKTLLANIDKHDVDLVLISNIDGAALPGTTLNLNEREANEATAEIVRNNPGHLRGLVWTRPNDGSAATVAPFFGDKYRLSQSQIFVGMKLHPDMNQFPADDPRVDPYLRICRSAQVPAVFHSGATGSNSDPRRIYAAARRFPDVPIILYHMGFLGPHNEAIAVVRESLDNGDAQLYLGTAQARTEDVLAAIATLGSDHVLYGTDATYYGINHYEKYTPLLDALRQTLSEAEFSSVVAGNARRLFRLE